MNIPLKRYWDLLVKYVRHQKRYFVLLTVLLLTSIGLQIFIPQITRAFIDTAQRGVELNALLLVGVAFIAGSLLQQSMAVGAVYVGENVAWIATNQLRLDLMRHCLHLDMAFHNDRSPGELIERLDNDIVQLSNFFSQMVIRVLANILLFGGIIVVLLFEDWRVGLAFAVYAVGALFVLSKVRNIAIGPEKRAREAEDALFGFLEERLAGTEDIRSSGAVAFVIHRLYQLHQTILDRRRVSANRYGILRFTAGMVNATGYAVAFVAGYNLFMLGAISLGTVYLIVQYVNLISRPLRELTHQLEELQNIGASIERVHELLAIEPQITDGPGDSLPHGALELVFDNVAFRYSAEGEPVLQDISFTLKPGQVMGLLGRTGSGKTTLTRLIFRLYQAPEGKITLGGVDVNRPTLRELRHRVAMVTQDVQLFEATIRDNITFFDKTISDEQILGVIEALELGAWFKSLPDGLDTHLETNGRSLSAGEAQLLAFTRVFLRNPGLVILDEASSRLDPATEQLIERAVDKLLRDRTGIIIAHRLGTVQRADTIMILQDGRIIEHDARAALASDPASHFYGLLQTGLETALV